MERILVSWCFEPRRSHDNLQQDLAVKRMAKRMTLVITLPKKGNLQQCRNYRTISLISHPSKVMLKILLNRLKPPAEKTITEEQAGFRSSRSTTKLIFNLRILCKKYFLQQQDLYHVFINFKKAFDGSLVCIFVDNHERSTPSAPTLSGSSNTCMTRLLVKFSSTAVQETGFEQQLESRRHYQHWRQNNHQFSPC